MKLFVLSLAFAIPTLGAPVVAINVSTITTSSGIVTVTTSVAHNLIINQGFCLGFSSGTCGVVETVPTTTTLTFHGNIVCPTTCGTIQAAPQIIVLQAGQPSTNTWSLNVVFWLTTTSGVAGTGRTSTWSGASVAQSAALNAGSFVELTKSYQFSTTLPITTVETIITDDYQAEQSRISTSIQPGTYYGVIYNGQGVPW